MQKINIFLASSEELKPEREKFEIELRRKFKTWYDKGFYLDLDIWEGMSSKISAKGLQNEYNNFVQAADIFVLLAYTKMGIYTLEEFNKAFGQFIETQKPFIFTYFKETPLPVEKSLIEFKERLLELGHFISPFKDKNDLWNQFNNELERLEKKDFARFEHSSSTNITEISGSRNINIQGVSESEIKIKTGKNVKQKAEKIYNIKKIDKADFS